MDPHYYDHEPRYPEIEYELPPHGDNSFQILGEVRSALRRAKVSPARIREFIAEATGGDYQHLRATVGRWVLVLPGVITHA
jgi:hypothetical protein